MVPRNISTADTLSKNAEALKKAVSSPGLLSERYRQGQEIARQNREAAAGQPAPTPLVQPPDAGASAVQPTPGTFRPAGSPEQDIASGMTSAWAGAPPPQDDLLKYTPAQDAGPTTSQPTPEDVAVANLRKLQEQYMNMRAAPGIGLNKDIRQGIAGQQEALRGVVGTMEAQQPTMEEARKGMQGVGAQYISGLEQLGKERASLYGARRGEMAADTARLAEAEQGFDASRVIRQVSQSPLNSAALSFAAGLVGGLKGLAGDMTPNQILGEVDKAVERDVMNQREQYQRMKDGMAARRTNFLDAVQMGADEQQALATSTLASMDQHKRALEFAQQRISNASDKAAMQKAISELDLQRGKMQLEVDAKNAANWVAMNKARLEGAAGIESMIAKIQGMDPETRAKTFEQAHQITKDPKYQEGKAMLESVGNVRDLMRKVPPAEQKQIWDRGIAKILADAAQAVKANDKGNPLTVLADFITAKMDQNVWTPEQRQMMAVVQAMANREIKAMSGSNVVKSEDLRQDLTRTWNTFDGFQRWMNLKENEALQGLSSARNLAKAAGPNVQSLVETDLVPGLGKIQLYQQYLAKQGYAKGQQ